MKISTFAKASVLPPRFFFIGEGAEAAQTAPGTHSLHMAGCWNWGDL